jgi:hypothetical protein
MCSSHGHGVLLAVNKPNLNNMESHCSFNLCPAVSTEFKSRGIPTTYSPLWKVEVLIKNGCASKGWHGIFLRSMRGKNSLMTFLS